MFVFADTGDEPAEVYEHVERMRKVILEAGLDFATVRSPIWDGRGLGQSMIEWRELKKRDGGQGKPHPGPFYIERDARSSYPIPRECTVKYKVKPIQAFVRVWAEIPRGYKGEAYVEEWLGISADEAQREKVSARNTGYDRARAYRHPLLEMGWRRSHCHEYLDSIDERAPRSACVFCPFHTRGEWRELKSKPAEWAKVVAYEEAVHAAFDEGCLTFRSKPYLHWSRVPIGEVDFDEGQQSLFGWDDECAGVCGV